MNPFSAARMPIMGLRHAFGNGSHLDPIMAIICDNTKSRIIRSPPDVLTSVASAVVCNGCLFRAVFIAFIAAGESRRSRVNSPDGGRQNIYQRRQLSTECQPHYFRQRGKFLPAVALRPSRKSEKKFIDMFFEAKSRKTGCTRILSLFTAKEEPKRSWPRASGQFRASRATETTSGSPIFTARRDAVESFRSGIAANGSPGRFW